MLRTRQRLGKYRIEARLGEGGFATVYRARDTIEGIKVALKVPHPDLAGPRLIEDFHQEIRLTARLDHPGILPIKNASIIDGRLVIVSPLGSGTLAERLQRRLAPKTALNYTEQILEAVACAHRNKIVHCDLKPENFIMFPDNRVRLTDFGIAKLAWRRSTLIGSGTGTVGYLAPEQAFGRPTFASDVFAIGLLMYRMFGGHLPTWPYEWPPPGYDKLRRTVHPDMIALIYRATDFDHKKRFPDASRMLAAFKRVQAPGPPRSQGQAPPQEWSRPARRPLADSAAEGIQPRRWAGTRSQASMRPVPWTDERGHALVPLVRGTANQACWCHTVSRTVQTVQARRQTRLALLPLVLWWHHPGPVRARVQRRPLRRPVRQYPVHPQGSHALHALLPLVSHQGSAQVETPREWQAVRQVRLGSGHGVLVGVSVVWL